MLIALVLLVLSDTTFTTTRYARVETGLDLSRMHRRGRLHISGDSIVSSTGIIRTSIDGYYDPGTGRFNGCRTEGSIPLSYRWRVSGDTILCGESLMFLRKYRDKRAVCITNFPDRSARDCKVDFSSGTVFVRYRGHTDIYIN